MKRLLRALQKLSPDIQSIVVLPLSIFFVTVWLLFIASLLPRGSGPGLSLDYFIGVAATTTN